MKSGLIVTSLFFVFLSGCRTTTGNVGQVHSYRIVSLEADWIRNGEPIEFEEELWYPTDGVENLLDSEVYILGEHRGVQYFVEKVDVRPYNRLYTKFAKNKFRYFSKRENK